MSSYMTLSAKSSERLPDEFRDFDVRFPERFVEPLINEFSREGDTVFDPFAGFGTTLIVAENLGRRGFGVESDRRRSEYIRSRMQEPDNLIFGDSRRLSSFAFPPVDLTLTSPPYPFREGKRFSPAISECPAIENGYDSYINCLRYIFAQVRGIMRPRARLIIEAGNIRLAGKVIPLAWDIAEAVSREFRFEGERVVKWDRPNFGFDHTYCLIFSGKR
ncbi:MAG: site-specific DNA-methyltransferase [Candidatus Krumholzibacteriota bacterium]|nr:site-specific DNA-methyltransferase [Candidatus Krumholzibacteriota bacterium]